MAIYTRTGDRGRTSLFNGQRVSKTDLRIEVYGTVDELNSMIGVASSEIRDKRREIRKELLKIQSDLFRIGSGLSNPTRAYNLQSTTYLKKRIEEFENLIDEITLKMPKLGNFILPGGGKAGAMLHLSRAACRRLERRIVSLKFKEKVDSNIIIYLNRLSDLLFTMARFVNFKEKRKEQIWPTYAKASAGERGKK
jgi:cob(I)alamin adenosyltransferase